MNKTKIEYADYTINPVKGLCPMACSYCYARAMYKRFKWNPEIRYAPIVMTDPFCYSKPSKVFVGSTMELFGDWIKPAWLDHILEFCQRETNKRHTFIFLTKCPQNLIKWSPFPGNCWVGVTATDGDIFVDAMDCFLKVESKIKFISLEPLLGWHIEGDILEGDLKAQQLDWLIIGQQTPVSAKTRPKIEWIQEIVEAADKTGIPVFEKNNLQPLLKRPLRQEFPEDVP